MEQSERECSLIRPLLCQCTRVRGKRQPAVAGSRCKSPSRAIGDETKIELESPVLLTLYYVVCCGRSAILPPISLLYNTVSHNTVLSNHAQPSVPWQAPWHCCVSRIKLTWQYAIARQTHYRLTLIPSCPSIISSLQCYSPLTLLCSYDLSVSTYAVSTQRDHRRPT